MNKQQLQLNNLFKELMQRAEECMSRKEAIHLLHEAEQVRSKMIVADQLDASTTYSFAAE